jgi:peptide/nickel transport system ATP-binding protein
MTRIGSNPVLAVSGLSVRVVGPPSYDVVRDINLSISAGDVFGLVGESGSGKTTTALALLGFARSGSEISGSVTIEGREMIAATESERRKARHSLVAYVPQDPTASLNPALRIGAQLTETMALRRRDRSAIDRSRINELLTKVQLPTSPEFLRRYPHQLSGGQLQRVCIAMAMVNRPRLIVFDEPTTGLDVTTQGHVLETIREVIASEDAAALYVTHDLAVIGSIATRIGVMYSGLLVEDAPTETLLSKSAHPYAKRLVLATPSLSQRRQLVGIPGAPLNPKDRGSSCPFAPRCSYAVERCREELPQLVTIDTDHRARCHRALDLLQASEGGAHAGAASWSHRQSEAPPLLVLAGVYASYGDSTVVHEVDFSVGDGECTALVGESGSGKTTLARCVNGIHPDSVEGYLGFAGTSLPWPSKQRPPVALREIQYIFQNPHGSLNPRHTVRRILSQPLESFDLGGNAAGRLARVRELLARVALPPEYENRYPSQLSGGERQRVAIARALAAEPRLIVCDEITSALDVSIQASILELLAGLRKEQNLTMLFITHNLGLVRAIADQIVILQHGRVVERGAAEDVLDHPGDPYTFELLANTPVLAEVGVSAN